MCWSVFTLQHSYSAPLWHFAAVTCRKGSAWVSVWLHFYQSGQLCLSVCLFLPQNQHHLLYVKSHLSIFKCELLFSGIRTISLLTGTEKYMFAHIQRWTASSNNCSLKNPSNAWYLIIKLLNYFLVTVLAACEDSQKMYCAMYWQIKGFSTAG